MQRQLNKALDAIAGLSESPSDALQVEVIAMGESSDADFPAIYADLFGQRTFDNRDGGWTYEVFNSFGLPDFLGLSRFSSFGQSWVRCRRSAVRCCCDAATAPATSPPQTQ